MQHRAHQMSEVLYGRLWLGSHYLIQQTCKGCHSSDTASDDLSDGPDGCGGLPFFLHYGSLLGQCRAVGFLSRTSACLTLGYSFWSCVVRLTQAMCSGLDDCFPNVSIHLHQGILLKCRFTFSRSEVGLMIWHL